MLTEQEKTEIEATFHEYPRKQHATLSALRVVQNHRGWISDEALADIAELLEISPDALDSVATFYNLIFRRPVGQHIIRVCDSVSCWIMGYEQVRAYLAERLGIDFGGTTPDGRFTMLPIQCLGTCDHAPALMLDEALYRDLTRDKLDQILEQYNNGTTPNQEHPAG